MILQIRLGFQCSTIQQEVIASIHIWPAIQSVRSFKTKKTFEVSSRQNSFRSIIQNHKKWSVFHPISSLKVYEIADEKVGLLEW